MLRRVLALVVGTVLASGTLLPMASAALPPDRAGDGITTITPTRVLDTRTGTGGHLGAVAARHTIDLDVRSVVSGQAVLLNLTVTGASASGFATAYPSKTDPNDSSPPAPGSPGTSTVNFTPGRAAANQAIVEVPSSGLVSLYTSATADLVVDVTGYYARTSEYGPYRAQKPVRAVDTRTGLNAPKRRVAAGGVVSVPLTDAQGASSAGQRAAVLNITATDSTGAGFLTVYNARDPRPTASTLNFTRGSTVAGMTIVKYYYGEASVYASASTHVVVDVIGWVPSSDSDYQPLRPSRLLDTRNGTGGTTGPVAAGGAVTVAVAGAGGVPGTSATHPPVAVEVNVTAVGPAGPGYVTAYDGGGTRPVASTVNYVVRETRANSATVRLSADGKLTLYTRSRTHIVVDVVGYFVAPTPNPEVATTPLPGATVGQPYRATLTATGGVAPYTWVAQRLPDGLTLDSATGVLSGTPTTPGKVYVEAFVRDAETVRSYGSGPGLYVHAASGGSVTSLAASWRHTCAVLTSGTVQCWGDNYWGQIGSSTAEQSSVPVTVAGLGGEAAAVTTGGGHSCALMADGDVKCWGANDAGQLGDGSTTTSSTPVTVTGLTGRAVDIAAGGSHTCAVLADGTVMCWGANSYGQLGNGSTISSSTAVAVSGLDGVASISGGSRSTCVVTTGGAARCWGANTYGELGDGSRTRRTSPANVVGLESGVSSIDEGYYHVCAVMSDGDVKCWGYNGSGEVTPGSTWSPYVLTPTTIPGLGGTATVVAASEHSSCAALTSGEARCWGSNLHGALGNGTTVGGGQLPSAVVGLVGVTALSVGGDHACAMVTGGRARCWGGNEYGQVGDSFTTNRLSPETVVGLEGSGS